jgi:hypothetical protein
MRIPESRRLQRNGKHRRGGEFRLQSSLIPPVYEVLKRRRKNSKDGGPPAPVNPNEFVDHGVKGTPNPDPSKIEGSATRKSEPSLLHVDVLDWYFRSVNRRQEEKSRNGVPPGMSRGVTDGPPASSKSKAEAPLRVTRRTTNWHLWPPTTYEQGGN